MTSRSSPKCVCVCATLPSLLLVLQVPVRHRACCLLVAQHLLAAKLFSLQGVKASCLSNLQACAHSS